MFATHPHTPQRQSPLSREEGDLTRHYPEKEMEK